MKTSDALRERVNSALDGQVKRYLSRMEKHRAPKILRDVIWGFRRCEPYELAIIDTPLFQRLRQITQTSLAFHTYPCAIHTRFEHSLGVSAVARRMLDVLEKKLPGGLDATRCREVELAALLHDISHGPYSHSSEKYYERLTYNGELHTDKNCSWVAELSAENPQLFANASASECLAYLIITSRPFKDLWSRIITTYRESIPGLDTVDLERVASMILGTDEHVGGSNRFFRQIVNGPFDADKLDYLKRDGYFTGLQTVVDIERLLNTITVITNTNGEKDIAVSASGASILEQVLFAKTQLFSCMYHHHKVRAAHQVVIRLLELLHRNNASLNGLAVTDPISFISLGEAEILRADQECPEARDLVERIRVRALPRRALVISYPCFAPDDDDSMTNFKLLDDGALREIEDEVERKLRIAKGTVMFDVPEPAKLDGTGGALVEPAPGGEPVPLQKIYPLGAWAKAHEGYRRVAYVFTTESDRLRVGTAAEEALKRRNVHLNAHARGLAKH